MNHFKTFILIAAMTALFMVIGFMIGGPAGMGLAFVFAAGMNLFTYWNADSIVLRTYHAREVETDDAVNLSMWARFVTNSGKRQANKNIPH